MKYILTIAMVVTMISCTCKTETTETPTDSTTLVVDTVKVEDTIK